MRHGRVLSAALIALFFTTSAYSLSTPPPWAAVGGSVVDQQNGYISTLQHDESVGALPGTASVSGGAATYTIPIELPPGRANMEPKVQLSYSSRSGGGVVGVGWQLVAGSSIHRCTATPAQDGGFRSVRLDVEDKLCFDGMRLIAVSGSYGSAGSVYRTELDQFAEITQIGALGANTSFVVKHKNNRTAYYGSSPSSRQVPAGAAVPNRWAISYEVDTANNSITYHYSDRGNGEYLLDEIRYTGVGTIDGDRVVQFNYEQRPDPFRSRLAGGVLSGSHRLKSIVTAVQALPVRRYEFSYETSPYTQRSVLSSATVCAAQSCLPLTDFSYYTPNIQWDDKDSSLAQNRATPVVGQTSDHDQVQQRDLNGDGLPELIHLISSYNSQQQLTGYDVAIYTKATSGPNAGEYVLVYDGTTASNDIVNGIYFYDSGDLNSDGIADFVIVDSNGQINLLQFDQNFVVQPLIATNITLPTLAATYPHLISGSLEILDLNGDGYQDVVYTDTDKSIYFHLNQATGQPHFEARQLLSALQSSSISNNTVWETVNYQDIDGDGVMDLVRTWQTGMTSTIVRVSFGAVTVQGGYFIAQTLSSSQTGLPSNVFYNQYTFADLNGDGLSDFIVADKISGQYHWVVYENRGDRSFQVPTLLGSSLGIHEAELFRRDGLPYLKVQALWGALRTGDIDSDGRDELLVATHSDDDVCLMFGGNPNQSGSFEPYNTTVCNDALHEDKAELVSHPGIEIAIDWSRYDVRRFYWSALDARADANGITLDRIIPDVVYAPHSSFAVRSGARSSGLSLKDIDNNGFTDFTYTVLAQHSELAGFGQQLMVGGSPYYYAYINVHHTSASPPVAGGYYEQKNLAGLGADEGRLVDTLERVDNGLGEVFEWRYAPLSKSLPERAGGLPFYRIPNDRYVSGDSQNEHFYFTSSMYVVSESLQDNGIGGLNQTTYSYQEAVYNRQGRGFQGFRTIVVDDIARGRRAVTDFHQIFPLAGQIEHVRTCLISDLDELCETAPLHEEMYTYRTQQTTAQPTYWSYPISAVKRQYALEDRLALISESITSIGTTPSDVDAYGNVLRKKVERFNGYQRVEQVIATTYDYSDVQDWWIQKPTQVQTTSQTLSRDSATAAPVAVSDDPVHWQIKQLEYDIGGPSYRKPNRVTSSASQSGVSQTLQTDFNSFGLPTSVTNTGASTTNSEQVRSTSMSYSADGYFVTQTTNDKGHIQSSHIAPAHGQATQVTDANGVSTQMTYDAFGRLVQTTIAEQKPIEQGMQWCQLNCPATAAVYYTFSQQEGSPTTRAYFDALKREIMVETQGFAGVPIYQRKTFDGLGRLAFESIPSFYANVTEGTHYRQYDALGRLTEKWVDRAQGGTIETVYTYNRHQVDIDVDDGTTLVMSRTLGADGQLIRTTDAQGGVTRYGYDALGNPIAIVDANGEVIQARYNGFSQKLQVDDPNMGLKSFTYNSFGEVEQETDANGDVISYTFDGLGRVTERRVNQVVDATFTFDSGSHAIGQLVFESSGSFSKSYQYDGLGRPISSTRVIDGESYVLNMAYDSHYGRLKSLSYPNGLTLAYDYDDFGYQTQTKNAATGYIYEQVTATDAFGHAVTTLKNNGTLTETKSYDSTSGQLDRIGVVSQAGVNVHDIAYTYGNFGNLAQQIVTYDNGAKSSIETYSYDALHRLTQSTRSFNGISHSEPAITYSYDAVGNLTSKSDFASLYVYGDASRSDANAGPNAVRSIVKPDSSLAFYSYDANGNLLQGGGNTLTYNAYNKPVLIQSATATQSFAYGPSLGRYKQVHSSLAGVRTTHYIDKLMEVIRQGDSATYKLYIGETAILSYSTLLGVEDAPPTLHYTLRDRLGSVVSVVDDSNTVIEHRSYDPFGKPRQGSLVSTSPATLSDLIGGTPITQRSFTDHEHLDDAQLIHMNGRVYDYNLGRFLSVDPFIQAPGNSQSLNPYSYIMNNPLAGTDPSGYVAECADEGGHCEETVTPEVGDRILEDEEGNRYLDQGGDTVTRIEKVSASKNGVTASVNNSTGMMTISAIGAPAEQASGTNQDNSDISGSKVGGKGSKKVKADFRIDKIKGHEDGWEDPHDAALAFYKQNEDAYQSTDKDSELIGFLIKADNGNYYFTNAVEVPATFEMSAAIRKPSGWITMDTLHTHPGGRGNQEGFSKTDAQAVLSGSTPGYYVRTPIGDVRFINKSIAKRTRTRWGAKGKSICPGGSPCMTSYGSSN